jgi:microcystin-dependent protein
VRDRWLTPQAAAPTTIRCRRLLLPLEVDWIMPVNGALVELTKEHNWEQSSGGITPEAAAAQFALLFEQYSEDNCMIGVIFVHAASQAPSGSLPCDGATYNRSDYPDLFDHLDAAYHIGSTQFTTPDLRGRCIVGDGTGTGLTNRPFATPLGVETVSLTIGQMPSHSHSYLTPVGVLNPLVTGPVPNASAASAGGFVGSNGSGLAHTNMQPSLPLHYAIWAK